MPKKADDDLLTSEAKTLRNVTAVRLPKDQRLTAIDHFRLADIFEAFPLWRPVFQSHPVLMVMK